MTATMTRREYAASLTPPLAIAGARGKLSREAHAAIAAAEAKGMQFKDTQYTINLANAGKPKEDKPVKEKTVSDKTVLESVLTYPRDTVWVGKDSQGKPVTANSRQICLNCATSLVGHDCANPRTLTAIYPSGKVCGETITLEVKS